MELKNSSIIDCLSDSFWTKSEFSDLLQNYAQKKNLDGVFFKVEKHRGDMTKTYNYGHRLDTAVKCSKEVACLDGTIKIQYFVWSEQQVSEEVEKDIETIIKQYLCVDCLDNTTLLPMYQQLGRLVADRKCEKTVIRFREMGKSVATFMIDLDHFKSVNDKFNHDVGSAVLFEFGNLVLQSCEEKAVVIHRSGDEIFLIMPYTEVIEPLQLAYQIRETVKHHQYSMDVGDIKLTAAQGICLINDIKISFHDAVRYAEEAYNPPGRNQSKQRDSVRMVCPYAGVLERERSNRDLAFVLVRSGLEYNCIFHNPFLDFISYHVSQISDIGTIQNEVNELLEWLSPNSAAGMHLLALSPNYSYICEWSCDELSFALLHGLCKNTALYCHGKKIYLIFHAKQENTFSIYLDDNIIYKHESQVELIKEKSYAIELPDCPIVEKYETRTTVIVYIGYDVFTIPEACFYHVTRIDARPTIGGSLPDFWEAALSELIGLFSEKPFINHIIVYGKKDCAVNFCKILENIKNWGNDEYRFSFLARKTQQQIETIDHFKKCLENHIHFIETGNDKLINTIKKIYEEGWIKKQTGTTQLKSHRFLERGLSVEPIRLSIVDGCRVETMEEALPTVLEIIRKYDSYDTREKIKDQAGRRFKELTNFKIVISKPNSKDIPDYYQGEKQKLDDYYTSLYGDNNGFFQKHLWENGQYDAVLDHIADLIDNKGNDLKYATRRAVLVIPHIINVENPKDVCPLGLVSICIAPRKYGNGIIFDFSFTWRTVEVVVGFPYSLYGSVRYSEYLLEEIRKRVDCPQELTFKMGTVSYLAYSLHMFLDDSYTEIVRGIINDATK